jgi:predicted RNase H-like nuclease (RuvC/YqgF family)
VKKNAQYHEMKHTIQEITTRNKILETQIKELKEENRRLRSTTDKLRSESVANKLLNKWIKNHHNNGFMMDMDSFQDDDLNCCLLK